MSSTLPSQSLQQPNLQTREPQVCPAVVFQIAGHWFALPQTALLQVVHRTALIQHSNSDKLVYLGKQPLSILNLHSLLAAVHRENPRTQKQSFQPDSSQSDSSQSESGAKLIVIAAVNTLLVGIPVDQPPILLDLPLDSTHAVPPAYYSAIGGIASHVVDVPQIGTVLLLNLSAVIQGI